jgi:hypothetical protein
MQHRKRLTEAYSAFISTAYFKPNSRICATWFSIGAARAIFRPCAPGGGREARIEGPDFEVGVDDQAAGILQPRRE